MRIDGPERLQISGSSAAGDKAPRPAKAGDAAPAPSGAIQPEDSSLQALVLQAMAGAEVDANAVAEAKKLLESGALDTAEAAARAAEGLMSRGI